MIDGEAVYFHKRVGSVSKTTIEEQEAAVAYLAKKCEGPDDFRELVDGLGLREAAQSLATRKRGAA